jgi:serine/threonine protein phosphatase PrpC
MCKVFLSFLLPPPYILPHSLSSSRYASEEIPSHIVSAIGAGLSQQESLYQSFLKTDKEFIKSNTSQLKAGCTSTVMVFDHLSGLTSVANSGDTRAVMSRLRTAVDLTRDMKSSSPIEIARVLSCGGYIINGRVLGSLAVARALGDCQLKEINDRAVIADPEVTSFYFQSDDEFIVIATDGLWDVMSSQVPVPLRCPLSNPPLACLSLLRR